ncbi:hypothetical protein ANN_03967 [Periplaneta americana]|uniref:Uncharacterized protein n=1 Tax=Periplaneta americana TaxID=6978 RepID=A0ABQ8T8T5_PERAM|nr:hypothetical protein ANN_03967 [Periplaneta americana]
MVTNLRIIHFVASEKTKGPDKSSDVDEQPSPIFRNLCATAQWCASKSSGPKQIPSHIVQIREGDILTLEAYTELTENTLLFFAPGNRKIGDYDYRVGAAGMDGGPVPLTRSVTFAQYTSTTAVKVPFRVKNWMTLTSPAQNKIPFDVKGDEWILVEFSNRRPVSRNVSYVRSLRCLDIHPEISKAAANKFYWYLVPESVVLSLFDDYVPTAVKANMAQVILEADEGEEEKEENQLKSYILQQNDFSSFTNIEFSLITKEGLLLVDIMPYGTTINSDGYVVTLKKLQVRLSRVRRHQEKQDVLLLHDNAQPYISHKTTDQIKKFG